MFRNKIVLIAFATVMFTGCAERGFPLPSILDHNTTNTCNVVVSKDQTGSKNILEARSEVRKIDDTNTTISEEKSFISDDLQNKISGILILLIGIAMII